MEFEWNTILIEILKILLGILVSGIVAAFVLFIKENFVWRLIKPRYSSYKNDPFARETIKYRFNSIISNLIKGLSNNKNAISYKEFQDTLLENIDFTSSAALHTDINDQNQELMSLWLASLPSYQNHTISHFLTNSRFIDSEYLFYYYILDKLGSLDEGNKRKLHPDYKEGAQFDPYRIEKLNLLERDFTNDKAEKKGSKYNSKIKQCLDFINRVNSHMDDNVWKELMFTSPNSLLHTNLSSNSSDLSQMFWSNFNSVYPHIDDSKKFWDEFLHDVGGKNINIIVDNFGIEFLNDLVLGYCLKKKGIGTITYHVKQLPIFVSDVIENDHILLFNALEDLINKSKELDPDIKNSYLNALKQLKQTANDSFIFKTNYFWNMPFGFAQLQPGALDIKGVRTSQVINEAYSIFNSSDLLIVKGDLNYRRLVEDKLWHIKSSTSKKIKYVKSPLLIIRSYKSNIVMDCKKSEISELEAKYGPDWKTEGRVGSIIFRK